MYEVINAEIINNSIYRFPEDVIGKMGYLERKGGQEKARHATGVEIRFQSDDRYIELSFDSDGSGKLFFYVGDYSIDEKNVQVGTNHFKITLHDRYTRYNDRPKGHLPDNLLRIIFGKGFVVSNLEILNDSVLPHNKNNKKVLLYGSSFTEGVGSFSYEYSYASLLGHLLNVDILNKGLSGNCFCESSTAKYLASCQCDAYVLELGMNMRGVMEADEFERRVDNLLKELSSTKRNIYVISSVDFFKKQFAGIKNAEYYNRNITFSQALKRLAKKYNIRLISMSTLMPEFRSVSADMLHPSTLGHITIATKLAKYLRM